MKRSYKIKRMINYLIVIIMCINFFSCKEKKTEEFYRYGTKEYEIKEATLNVNTEEAAILFADYYFGLNPEKKGVKVKLHIIYGDSYIFSDGIILFNAKTGDYTMRDTYWINGKTKEIKKSKVDKVKILLTLPIMRFEKIIHNPLLTQ